jgi:hypothetical protein
MADHLLAGYAGMPRAPAGDLMVRWRHKKAVCELLELLNRDRSA